MRQGRLSRHIRWAAAATVAGATVLSAKVAQANSCSWASPYENGRVYNGISVGAHGGGSLSDPRVVVEFWGSLNPSSSCYSGFEVNVKSQVSRMLGNPDFWDRYFQYGVNSGGIVGTYYGGQFSGDLCGATLSEGQIRSELQLEQYYGAVPFDLNNPYIYLVFLGGDVRSPVVSGGGRHDFDVNPYLLSYTYPYGYIVDYNDPVDSLLAAHEVMEAATDPWFSDSNPTGSPGYWSTVPSLIYPFGGVPILEIGDLCNGIPVVVNGVTWQKSWFQDQCACQ